MSPATASGSSRSSTRGRQVNHVTRACDKCRKRRIRCDGVRPVCATCTRRGWPCTYADEDKRKSNNTVDNLRTRVTLLESMLPGGTTAASPIPSTRASSQPSDVDIGGAMPQPTGAFHALDQLAASAADLGTMFDPGVSSATTLKNPSQHDAGRQEHDMHTEGDYFSPSDRLKRRRGGPLIHFGPTSIWSHDQREKGSDEDSAGLPTQASLPGEEWRRHLPPGLEIDRQQHDDALELFAAYYAPWCLVVDMPAFLRDLNDLSAPQAQGPYLARGTSAYTPLLHCAIVFMGLSLRQGSARALSNLWQHTFHAHCMQLVFKESSTPTTSTLRGLNLLSSCLNFNLEVGYTFYGMTIASMHALGLNVDSTPYVQRGLMTAEEQSVRESTFWTTYLQDILRAMAAGRPPMVPAAPDMPLPAIDSRLDRDPWVIPTCYDAAPQRAGSLSGMPSMRSTVLHWAAKLGQILRAVLDTLYSVSAKEDQSRFAAPKTLQRRLATWLKNMPIHDPATCPLPHVLLLHLTYHLVVIYLHRPFYRSSPPDKSGQSSADRCNVAAASILRILRLYNSLHGLQHGPLTLNQVIFGAAGVFILQSVSERAAGLDTQETLDCLEECLQLLSQHAKTWATADSAFEVLRRLRSEWLPERDDDAFTGLSGGPGGLACGELEWLQGDWFLNQDLLDFVSQYAVG